MVNLQNSQNVWESGCLMMSSMVFSATMEHPPFRSFVHKCVGRHLSCDWGDCCPEDSALNDLALAEGGRILSAYNIPGGLFGMSDRLWIITEVDRSYTTILFPSEY